MNAQRVLPVASALAGVLSAVPADAAPALGLVDTGDVAITSTSAAAPQAVVDVAGPGVLHAHLAQVELSSGSAEVWVRVTLDGVVLNGGFTRTLSTATLGTSHAKGPFLDVDPRTAPVATSGSTQGTPFTWVSGSIHTTTAGNIYKAATTPLRFKTRLQVEVYRVTTGATTARTRVLYAI